MALSEKEITQAKAWVDGLCNEAKESLPEGSDYEDMAAHLDAHIRTAAEQFSWDDELAAQEPEMAKWALWVAQTMPDGYNCPRSFLDWLNA